ncbi:MAG: LamG-like jellyroll fold domain-containing protein [Candidatus Bathycorpusculaceae bacterium]
MREVSVVVSTYSKDRLNYLLDCIESLRKQSFKPVEVILVLDPVPDLVEFYKSRLSDDVKIVVGDKCGLSNARNVGVKSARGEIIAFVDDDAVAGTSGVHNITVAVKDNHNEIAKRTWLLTVDANLVMPFDTSSTPVADYAGYDNNGTVTGATWTPNGKIGGAYIFDGNDYIKIEDSPNIGGDGTWTEITIEFWIYITQNQRGTRIIAKRGSTTGTYGYQIGFQSSTSKPYNTIYFDIWNAAGTLYEIEYQALSLNTWYYIVCTYNSTEGLKLYIDGNLRASLAGSGNIHSSTGQPLFLGCRYGTSDYFIGLLDEVRIYPKALTAEQINHSYYQTKNLLVGSSPPTTQFASAILMYLTAILASQLVCTVILLSKTKRKWKTNRLSPIIYREEVDWKPLILRKLP